MDVKSLYLILSGAGIIQTIFLAIYIFLARRIQIAERVLLGLLLLFIAIRLTKSVGWYFFQYEQPMFLNAGFASHGFIGPILLLYFLKKAQVSHSYWTQWLILLPPTALLGLSPLLELGNFWYRGGYTGLLYFTLCYLIACAGVLWRIYRQQKIYFPWYRNLFLAVSIFCLGYFTNFVLGINSYISGPVAYSISIYAISFVLFTNHEIFTPLGDRRKYKNINLSSDQISLHHDRITTVMEEQKPYLDTDFSLGRLSELTSIPKHLLSRFFSENMNQSFTDFTNTYRIHAAKDFLKSRQYQHHKIAHIAYESGFNSISSFNLAFKKHASNSPSAYRKEWQQLAQRSSN